MSSIPTQSTGTPAPEGERHRFGMEPPVRRSIRLWTFAAMAAVLLMGLMMAFGPLALATYQLKGYCERLPPGVPLADLQAQAAEQGFAIGPVVDGQSFLAPVGARIKLSCELRFDASGRLLSSRVDGL